MLCDRVESNPWASDAAKNRPLHQQNNRLKLVRRLVILEGTHAEHENQLLQLLMEMTSQESPKFIQKWVCGYRERIPDSIHLRLPGLESPKPSDARLKATAADYELLLPKPRGVQRCWPEPRPPSQPGMPGASASSNLFFARRSCRNPPALTSATRPLPPDPKDPAPVPAAGTKTSKKPHVPLPTHPRRRNYGSAAVAGSGSGRLLGARTTLPRTLCGARSYLQSRRWRKKAHTWSPRPRPGGRRSAQQVYPGLWEDAWCSGSQLWSSTTPFFSFLKKKLLLAANMFTL